MHLQQLIRAWGKGQEDDHAPPGPVSFLGRDSKDTGSHARVLCACAGTHGSQALCVIGWALHPLRRELHGPLCFLDMMIWLNLFWSPDISYKQCGLEEFPIFSGLLFPNMRKGVRTNGHPVTGICVSPHRPAKPDHVTVISCEENWLRSSLP